MTGEDMKSNFFIHFGYRVCSDGSFLLEFDRNLMIIHLDYLRK